MKPKYDISSLDASKKSRSVNRAIFNQYKTIIEFVDKYPMFTRKHIDFLDWKEIVALKQNNIHKTIEGKNHMLNLKLGMNRGRLLNSNLLTSSDKLNVIRWNNSSSKQYHTKADIRKKFNIRNILTSFLLVLILIVSAIAYVVNLSEDMDEITTFGDETTTSRDDTLGISSNHNASKIKT